MKKLACIACFAALSACVPPPPTVSAFNGDSVTVRTYLSGRSLASDLEAQGLCERGGKPRSEYLSSRPVPDTLDQDHLYACLNS